MKRLTDNKIVLVRRTTRLQELLARFNTVGQARFYVEHLGADFSDYESEDATYRAAVLEAEGLLAELGRVQVLDRAFLPNFVFGDEETVVVIGQDGLVANTLKYLKDQPVIAVNPDPRRWDGVLLPFEVRDISNVVVDVFARRRSYREITMAVAELNNGQSLCGVNDIFIGPKSHVSAQYQISVGQATEQQSSSGIIVSTGLGATGWLKSILAGAQGVSGAFGRPFRAKLPEDFCWEADYLFYTVREPFPSRSSEAKLVFGKISADKPMTLVSKMPGNGVIFSDGIESDFLEFNSGTQALIRTAPRKGRLIA